jgi:transposase
VEHIGIDVHKNQSQVCILTDDAELIEKRIRTDRARFAEVFGARPRARILIEASTESEWVARCLESHDHEVIVADPNYAPMYARRSRRIKTDRRDARALAEACRIKAYRKAHRATDAARHVRGRLAVRESLVQTRTKYISLVRALLRREGLRVRPGSSSSFRERVGELEIPRPLQREIAPLLRLMTPLNRQIERATKDVEKIGHKDPAVRRLCTAPGVGPVTAASFVATIDTPERFRGAHQVEAYLGLVPRELSSGEKQRKGRITKAGNRRTRSLLVEAAWALLRTQRPGVAPLRDWTERLAGRRGKRVAVVALARKLAGILYAMMRDETEFEDERWTTQKQGV